MATEAFETFEGYLAEALKDPEFQEAWETSEPTYQVARLRILRGLTQAELIALGWRITQLLRVNLEQDEDGCYLVSDNVSVVYGIGDTRFEAEQDYIVSLIEYYQLLISLSALEL